MSFQQKYNKYKNKYLKLKNQIGSSNLSKASSDSYEPEPEPEPEPKPFYFSVYTFTSEPLDEIRKQKMIELLKSIYGGDITVFTNLSELTDPTKLGTWFNAQEYIESKSIYENLKNITEFQINNVPEILKNNMNDEKLTRLEYEIKNRISDFELNTLSVPIIEGKNIFSRGWGFWGQNVAAVTLVEIIKKN